MWNIYKGKKLFEVGVQSCILQLGVIYFTKSNKLLVETDDKCKCLSSSYQVGSGSATQSNAGESDDFLDIPSAKALQNRITKVRI